MAEKGKGTAMDGVMIIAKVAVLYGLLAGIIDFLLYLVFPAFSSRMGVLSIVVFPIVYVILAPLVAFISEGILYLLARLFGGNGSFSDQFYLAALFFPALIVLTLPVLIPVIGAIIGILIELILGLYGLYLAYLIIQGVHSLSKLKAAVVVLLPVLLALLFGLFLLFMLFFSSGGIGDVTQRVYSEIAVEKAQLNACLVTITQSPECYDSKTGAWNTNGMIPKSSASCNGLKTIVRPGPHSAPVSSCIGVTEHDVSTTSGGWCCGAKP